MVILERSRANQRSLPLLEKNSTIATIVRLEGQIHSRRQKIKGLTTTLHMCETLHNNGFMDNDTFSAERDTIVNRMRELDREQHLDRKGLRPFKKATEKKGKSPFKHALSTNVPTESESGVRRVPSRTKDKVTPIKKKTEPVVLYEITKPKKSNMDGDPQTTRITQIRKQLESLRIQKENGEISPKGYRAQQQELARILHEAERQRGHKPVRTKRE